MKPTFVLMILFLSSQISMNGAQISSAEQEILKLDNQRSAALIQVDIPMLEKFMTDDFAYTHTSGRTQTKTEFLEEIRTGVSHFKSQALTNVKVRIYGDVALVTGHCDLIGMKDQKDVVLSMYFTEVYKRTNGRWQWVLWQSTRTP
jgi:ketosteroid isomerase-like protein